MVCDGGRGDASAPRQRQAAVEWRLQTPSRGGIKTATYKDEDSEDGDDCGKEFLKRGVGSDGRRFEKGSKRPERGANLRSKLSEEAKALGSRLERNFGISPTHQYSAVRYCPGIRSWAYWSLGSSRAVVS